MMSMSDSRCAIPSSRHLKPSLTSGSRQRSSTCKVEAHDAQREGRGIPAHATHSELSIPLAHPLPSTRAR
eukprot:scaffold22621_cov24-Tisochrysis_lutea.AAC.2